MWKEESEFKFVSLGRVAENKKRDTKIIEVTPFEALPDVSSELNSAVVKGKRQGVSFHNEELYSVEIKLGTTIPATWLGETNSVLAPDVRRGEQVRLFKQGDSDKWYWSSLGRDDHLRRLETKIYRWSANPKIEDAETTAENCYQIEISAHDKHITLSTGTANGEFTQFILQFNLKDGVFVVQDGEGNSISLDSMNTVIKLLNKDQTLVELDKEILNLFSLDKINVETKDFTIKAETVTVTCASYNLECDDYKVKAGNGLLDIGNMTFKGKIKLDGPVEMTKALTSADGATFAKVVSALNI